MTPDYPAAHSMDTAFFAVDRDGCVAQFGTGEAGCVPVIAPVEQEDYAQLDAFIRDLPPSELIYDVEGSCLPVSLDPGALHPPYRESSYAHLMMSLKSLDAVAAEISDGSAIPVRVHNAAGIIWRRLAQSRFDEIHQRGQCLGCVFIYSFEEQTHESQRQSPGLFHYDHLTENWISGPFGRRRIPLQPIHVDQLPPRLRQAIRSVSFENLRFADTPHIQPLEYFECASWECAWLDLQGNIKPVPGREEDYAEEYQRLVEGCKEFKVQPPAIDEE